MRAALSACALILASIVPFAASAQSGNVAIQPNAVLQVQQTNLLDGVWSVNGLGALTLTTRADGLLEGSLDGRACHGQYLENAFSIFCPSVGRGPYLISGAARPTPPVATARRRSELVSRPAIMEGQIHQSYMTARGHTEQIATLHGTRP